METYELSVTDCINVTRLHLLLFPELTEKEVDCIYWLSFGLSIREIANITKVSESMVKKRIKSAVDKLGVVNLINLKLIYHNRVQNYHLKQVFETNRLLSLLVSSSNIIPLA